MRRSGVVLLLLLAVGCRRETVVQRAARLYRKQQETRLGIIRLESARYARMSDGQLLHTIAVDGLGIIVRPQSTKIRVGEPLRLHLVFANLAATAPVAATTCQGFSILVEDETQGELTSADLSFDCPKDDPLRDNSIELPHGAKRTIDMSTAETPLRFNHAGTYVVTLQWRAFRTADPSSLRGSEYSVAQSNKILVDVHN